jgi:uncharacterized small protein (DUF1192 family)
MFMAAASTFDESLVRMTSFNLVVDKSLGGVSHNINQGEIAFLIEALQNEISRLEAELAKV